MRPSKFNRWALLKTMPTMKGTSSEINISTQMLNLIFLFKYETNECFPMYASFCVGVFDPFSFCKSVGRVSMHLD